MYTLQFNILSYWRVGTGQGIGTLLDEKCHRDLNQLPCIPGRSVKGLLRDAIWRLEKWGHVPTGKTDSLFGTRTKAREEIINEQENNEPGRNITIPGRLRVSNAQFDDELRNYFIWLRTNQHKDFINFTKHLFRNIHATAMKDGVADKKTLRSLEVTIPMKLYAPLSIKNIEEDDIGTIEKGLPLIRSIGAGRNRGLGRVSVTFHGPETVKEVQ